MDSATAPLSTTRFDRTGFQFDVNSEMQESVFDLVEGALNRDGEVRAEGMPDEIATISEAHIFAGEEGRVPATLEEAMSFVERNTTIAGHCVVVATGTQTFHGGEFFVFAIRKHERADKTGFVVTTIPLTSTWARHYKVAHLSAT